MTTTPSIPIPEVSFHDFVLPVIKQHYEKDKNSKAFIPAESETEFATFGDLYHTMHSLANFLDKIGFGKNQIATICLPNTWHYAPMFIAVSMVGGTTTGLSDHYTEFETIRQLKDSTTSLILTVSTNLEKILKASQECPNLKHIILLDLHTHISTKHDNGIKIYSWQEATANPSSFDTSKTKIDVKNDLIAIPYSSGTTGMPKGVMISHYNYVANFIALIAHAEKYMVPYQEPLPENEIDYAIIFMPFYHASGFFSLFVNLLKGRTIIIIKKYTPELLFKMIEKYKIRNLPVPPMILNFMAKSSLIDKYDLSSLRCIVNTTGPLKQEVAEVVKRRLPKIQFILQSYGMTELTTGTHVSNLGSRKVNSGTVGIPIPNVECKIIDPITKISCKINESGEVVVRSPTIMKGYWNNETATKEILDTDGWLHTGDIGSVDEEGNLFIHDRIKELIKVKGYQVPPAELEGLIHMHPDVQDVAVIGIPHETYGEIPMAVVVKKSKNLTAKEVIDFVKGKVSPYKELKGGVEFVNEIPRNHTGKILRRVIKENYRARLSNSKI